MKGYVVIDTEVLDSEAYSEFAERIPAALAAHGGRFLVRTNEVAAVEGDWAPQRFVIVEFDDLEAARGFIGSSEYGALDDVRSRAVRSRIVVVEGT
ncbi:MAG: DUF1330 domain-containing protein [bacterium]|nr:DUF1330 domain-containing protein [bacterium]